MNHPLKIYQYPKCDSCRKAVKFLSEKKVKVELVDITENPPTRAELEKMLKIVGDRKKLFNTSGVVYKEMKLSEKLPSLSDEKALDLLAKNGRLIKRPFLLGKDWGILGFKEADWQRIFS
jgi:arsenate reductase